MKVTILGATGNMGRATIKALLPLPFVILSSSSPR